MCQGRQLNLKDNDHARRREFCVATVAGVNIGRLDSLSVTSRQLAVRPVLAAGGNESLAISVESIEINAYNVEVSTPLYLES